MADLDDFMQQDSNQQQFDGGLNFDNNEDPFASAGMQMNNQDDLA